MTRWLLVAVLLCLPATVWAQTQRFALVVGNNEPLDDQALAKLDFADDDALRMAELFDELEAEVRLLTVVDAETQKQLGGWQTLAERAKSPSRQNLLEAIGDLERAIDAVEGETELYFYFSGHGSTSSANAHLHLLDSPFSRTDLFNELLPRLRADRVHVIIDACNSWSVVNSRGRVAVDPESEARYDLRRWPQVGFLLSTSGARESHEWSDYKAGVFTYLLLGALRGAADLDPRGDSGVVSYLEVEAYVRLASHTPSGASPLSPFIRPPLQVNTTLVDLRGRRCARVPAALAGHHRVSDVDGRRLLDFNKRAGVALELALPPARRVLLQPVGAEAAQDLVVDCAPPEVAGFVRHDGPRRSARGSEFDAFFKLSLGPDFMLALHVLGPSQPLLPAMAPPTPWTEEPWIITSLATGGAALIGGVVASVFASRAVEDGRAHPGDPEPRERATWAIAGATGAYAAGLALIAAGLWGAYRSSPEVPQLGVAPDATGEGASVWLRWELP